VNKLVCITGLPGSGKSVVSDYFVNNGYQYIRFGQITIDEIKKRGLELNEKNERKIREGFRKKHGMAAFAILNLPKFKKALKTGNVIGDGLYSFEEYKLLKEKFGKYFIDIAVFTPPKLRYNRLKKRKDRPLSKKEVIARDYSEMEILNKGGTIAMADYTIVNNKDLKHLMNQIKEVEKAIEKK